MVNLLLSSSAVAGIIIFCWLKRSCVCRQSTASDVGDVVPTCVNIGL